LQTAPLLTNTLAAELYHPENPITAHTHLPLTYQRGSGGVVCERPLRDKPGSPPVAFLLLTSSLARQRRSKCLCGMSDTIIPARRLIKIMILTLNLAVENKTPTLQRQVEANQGADVNRGRENPDPTTLALNLENQPPLATTIKLVPRECQSLPGLFRHSCLFWSA